MTELSAIPVDAESDPTHTSPPTEGDATTPNQSTPQEKSEPGDERLETLNRIARRNHEQATDPQTTPEPQKTSPTTDSPSKKTPDEQQSRETRESEPNSNRSENNGSTQRHSDELVPVTIDGRTEMIPLKTVVKNFQIEAAARKRLNEAAVIYKRLRQHETVSTPTNNPPQPGTTGPSPEKNATTAPGENLPFNREARNLLDQAEPESPTSVAATAPVNPEQLAEYVFLRQEIRGEKQRLIDTQPHIARDAKLSGMHAQAVMEAMENYPGLPTRDYFDHATESVNQWLVQLTTAKLTRSTDTGQRLMDKRAATSKQAPSGINRKVPSGTDAPSPPTYADKIRQMKQARGLT